MSSNSKKILVLASNPKDTSKLKLDEEIREIDEGLRRAKKRKHFQLSCKLAVRARDFYRHILDIEPQIIHFSGYGTLKDGIFLETETGNTQAVSLDALSRLFELFASKGVECVLLNACYSAEQANAISAHIPYVIGMSKDIGDRAAIAFSIGFYDALGAGETFEFAFRLGCAAIELDGVAEYDIPILKKGPSLETAKIPQQPISNFIPPSPYRGLLAFQEEDTEFFFGRDILLDDHFQPNGQTSQGLMSLVQHNQLVAVVGASGSGKSSLVFAGLLPRLRKLDDWQIIKFRPSSPDNRPLHNLAAALCKLLPSLNTNDGLMRSTNRLAENFKFGEITFQDILAEVKRQFTQTRQLLIVVDQFEELYVQCSYADREIFLNFLIEETILIPGIKLIITLRADFCKYIYNDRRLSDYLQSTQVIVGPMTKKELASAIENPARKLNVEFQPGLAERILEDIGQGSDNLPLLEFTLNKLWKRQKHQMLTHEAYTKIGGIKQALAQQAEEVLRDLNHDKQKIAKRLFMQLVVPSADAPDMRRTAMGSNFNAEEWEVAKSLADQEKRLLVVNLDPITNQNTLEIIHEALLREWKTLREWIDENRQFRIWQEELRNDIRRWHKNKRSKEFLLHGMALVEAENKLNTSKDLISSEEEEFIRLSKRTVLIRRSSWGILAASVTAAFLGVGMTTWQERIEKQYNAVLALSSGEDSSLELLPAAHKVLERANSLSKSHNESDIEISLRYYRAVIQYSEAIKTKNDKHEISFIEELHDEAEQGLVKVIIDKRLPKLEEQLNRQLPEVGRRQSRRRNLFEEQYTEGAIKTTYAILRREFGAKADIYNSGQIFSSQEASRMPCFILAEIERLWREYTNNQCGWYSKKDKTIYRDPSCELLNKETLTAKVFDYPFEASINRLEECQVIPANVTRDPASKLFE